jgi:hypothetical protein
LGRRVLDRDNLRQTDRRTDRRARRGTVRNGETSREAGRQAITVTRTGRQTESLKQTGQGARDRVGQNKTGQDRTGRDGTGWEGMGWDKINTQKEIQTSRQAGRQGEPWGTMGNHGEPWGTRGSRRNDHHFCGDCHPHQRCTTIRTTKCN